MKPKLQDDLAGALNQDFFEKVLPAGLKTVDPDRVDVRGKIQVTLNGMRRQTWTVDLTQRTVSSGPAVEPDALLEATADDWLELTMGEIFWEEALELGSLKRRGDMTLVLGFFSLMSELFEVLWNELDEDEFGEPLPN